ncbi:DEAD/DEAH box helicase [Corynebacterium sp.]|uniref:DEAD/DEAH box helicase n=1 Tax=Corynebacterium sp. TaxID=1720 RepID=UPI003734EAC4
MTSGTSGPSLRVWQREALDKFLSTKPKDFLAVATPGAGKTTFALTLASTLVADKTVQRVIVVVPTEHLKFQWSEAAKRFGLALDPKFTNSSAVNPAYDGIVVTYAQVGMHPFKHHAVTSARKTLVIMDEIHHAGDAKSWGDGVYEAYNDAEHRLALTGTPFRSDDAAIPFVRYVEDNEGHQISEADYTYGYAEALKDGVVRPVVFLAYSGEAQWRDSAGEEYSARLGEPLNAEQTARAWKTALDPKGDWISSVLRAAHTRLMKIRTNMPDAGGLVLATDTTTARAYAKLLEQISSTPVAVILSDDPGSSERIDEFSASQDEWMVAVRMVSEGVDVPRLAVGVYATSSATPLFFAQAIGRFVRSRMPGESASVFLPSVPVLLKLAEEMEVSRDHVLGKPDREKLGWDDDLLAVANQQEDEPDELGTYESLGASAELDSLIFDGSTYGTPTLAGSAEEREYLGLPGLLDAEQVKTLLRKRQSDQLDAREAEERARKAEERAQREREEILGTSTKKKAEPSSTSGVASDEIPALRKELNTLVSIRAGKTGRPHGAIHTEVRKACGGPPTALCTAEQLRDRIAYLRDW